MSPTANSRCENLLTLLEILEVKQMYTTLDLCEVAKVLSLTTTHWILSREARRSLDLEYAPKSPYQIFVNSYLEFKMVNWGRRFSSRKSLPTN